MPQKGQRKCKLCGNYITDMTEAIEYKGGYVHSECFAISIKAIQDQRIQRKEERDTKKQQNTTSKTQGFKIPKKGLSEEEYAEKQDFFSSLKEIMGVQKLPAKVYPVTENLMKKYPNFTYSNMLLTLRYCQNHEMEMGSNCLGLIPYYYDEALAEAESIKQAQQNVNETMSLMDEKETNIIRINPAAHKRNNKIIDIEGIGKQDERN